MARKKSKASPDKGVSGTRRKKKLAAADAFAGIEAQTNSVVSVPADAMPSIVLPECCDSGAATGILHSLLAVRGSAVDVDASCVSRASAQSIQVLLSAVRTWQADGQSFKVVRPTDAFVSTAALLGFSQTDLMIEVPIQ